MVRECLAHIVIRTPLLPSVSSDHHERNDALQARSHTDLRNLQRAVGQKIAAHWIATREQRVQWINDIVLN